MIQKMLFCDGSHFEMGRKQGELLKAEIKHNLIAFWTALKTRSYEKREVIKNAQKLEKLMKSKTENYLISLSALFSPPSF